MATQGTVKLLSQGSGEDLGSRCQRPKARDNSFPDLLDYRGRDANSSDFGGASPILTPEIRSPI